MSSSLPSSVLETVCRNVKRRHEGDHVERWVGSGLLVAERQFRKVIGFRQIPLLLSSLDNADCSRTSRTFRPQVLRVLTTYFVFVLEGVLVSCGETDSR